MPKILMANDSRAGFDPAPPKTGLRGVLLPTCREMTRHSSDRLDEPVPWWRQPGIWLHLLFCRLCRRYRRQVKWIHAHASESSASAPTSPPLAADTRTRMKQKLAAAAAAAPLTGNTSSDSDSNAPHA